MEYRAVGNRCAVILEDLDLPIPPEQALDILCKKGFVKIDVDLSGLARQCVGKSQYRRGAQPSEAPDIVDCSSFIKWLFAQRGIWLPRRTIQQKERGEILRGFQVQKDDVVFVSGHINYYRKEPRDGVGHVGIATERGTIIHAANTKEGIIETSYNDFVSPCKFRGARRYVSHHKNVITLQTPPAREVEIADDIRWIILQSL